MSSHPSNPQMNPQMNPQSDPQDSPPNNTLLVLNISPQLEDDMVDYLLDQTEVSGFTSYPVRGHGEHSYLSIAEQVSGRRKRIQFEIIMPAQAIDGLLGGLACEVGKGIAYWQLPVMNFGRIDNEV